MIDYSVYHRLGVFMHGTLLLKGDSAESLWSTTIAETRKTQPFPITAQLFRTFWRVMDDLPEFKRGWVRNPDSKPDLSQHNIMAMVLDESKPTEPLFKRRHEIPIEKASNQLRDLLLLIGVGSCK